MYRRRKMPRDITVLPSASQDATCLACRLWPSLSVQVPLPAGALLTPYYLAVMVGLPGQVSLRPSDLLYHAALGAGVERAQHSAQVADATRQIDATREAWQLSRRARWRSLPESLPTQRATDGV